MRSILPLAALLTLGAASPPTTVCTPGPYILFFQESSAVVGREGRGILNNALENAEHCGDVGAAVTGHSDTSEPPAMARKRAETVRDYLAGNGFPRVDITVKAVGARSPRVRTAKGVKERANRRVEITYGLAK